jgi:hypothetical protein
VREKCFEMAPLLSRFGAEVWRRQSAAVRRRAQPTTSTGKEPSEGSCWSCPDRMTYMTRIEADSVVRIGGRDRGTPECRSKRRATISRLR